jgi:hypothetical protein
MALFTWLGTTLFPPSQYAVLVTAQPATEESTPLAQPVIYGAMLSPRVAPSLASVAPPTQPSRLEIDGPIPIHASVLPYDGDELEPPNGDFLNAFTWTRRGLPGAGAYDTTYIFGHTYAGPTPGVFDRLQKVSDGASLSLTTQTEQLHYRLVNLLTVDESDADFRRDPRVWTVGEPEQRGDYVVIIACKLNADGSSQTGAKTIAVFQKG